MAKAKYQIIADNIRSRINSKEYQTDSIIPSEKELQNEFGVSRHTIRQALAVLINEGLLRSEKGSGTYVKKEVLKNKTIGVITTYVSDYIFPSIIRGIEQTLRENGYSLLLASTNNNVDQEKKCLELMLEHGVDGLIIEPTKSNQYNPNLTYYLSLKKMGIPIVMIHAYYEELDFPYIAVDDVASGFLATNTLIEAGHTNNLLITKIDDIQGKLRMKGFLKAHDQQNLYPEPENILTFSTESSKDIIKKTCSLLKRNPNITGIVGYNDEICYALLQDINDSNPKFSNRLSIIGQDDSQLSLLTSPKLSTISHPKEKLGQDAAKWMISALSTNLIPDSILYQPKLILRESVKKI